VKNKLPKPKELRIIEKRNKDGKIIDSRVQLALNKKLIKNKLEWKDGDIIEQYISDDNVLLLINRTRTGLPSPAELERSEVEGRGDEIAKAFANLTPSQIHMAERLWNSYNLNQSWLDYKKKKRIKFTPVGLGGLDAVRPARKRDKQLVDKFNKTHKLKTEKQICLEKEKAIKERINEIDHEKESLIKNLKELKRDKLALFKKNRPVSEDDPEIDKWVTAFSR